TSGLHRATPTTTRHELVTVPVAAGVDTQPLFMRNLVCDISPHLMFDHDLGLVPNARKIYYAEHHFWHPNTAANPAAYMDLFDANPWYHTHHGSAVVNDNHHVYTRVSQGKILLSGTIHPPCTTVDDPDPAIPTETYLFRNAIHPIAVWDWSANPSYVYSVQPRGWGVLAQCR